MAKEPLGIKRLEAIHWYVKDLGRSHRFYTERFDFAEVARSSPDLEARGKQQSAVFEAGPNVRVIVSTPKGEGGAAARWLGRHPAGVGSLVFEVHDIDKTFRVLESREGTPTGEIETHEDARGGKFRTFAITTPFGDTKFRFVQREAGFHDLYPGVERAPKPLSGGANKFGFGEFDHVTSNFTTLAPALLWMEHVCGFERYWNIEFHTNDVRIDDKNGSGLRSVVMWDPTSGVKFANNEPFRPFFRASQIALFLDDQHGAGVQHVAMTVKDILGAVRAMRESGVTFMPTSGSYYDALPERLKKIGVGTIDENIDDLRKLQILVDGSESHKYMLQIFLREAAGLYGDKDAGPFFYEIIQRKGDRGFGGGNFRALFESIERQQKSEGRI